jgi:hypothetical protein
MVLRSLPDRVRQRDLSEMVDAFSAMWRDARGLRQKGRVLVVVLLPFPRLWIAEWWDAMTDLDSGAAAGMAHAARVEATRTATRLVPLPVRVRPLTLALVVCAMASRFVSAEALFFSSLSEFVAQVTAFFGGLAFFVVVASANAAGLLKPSRDFT